MKCTLESESGLFLTLCLGISGAQNENLRPNIQQIYPQLVGKIISETNFATLKWFSYARKWENCAFSQTPLMARFWNFPYVSVTPDIIVENIWDSAISSPAPRLVQ